MQKVTEVTLSFRAMNTDVQIIICAFSRQRLNAKKALQNIKETFIAVEKTLTRFDSESELSKLNTSAGQAFTASETLFNVVKLALDSAHETNGIFDPSILPDLIAAGYNRSFELLPQQRKYNPLPFISGKRSIWRDIILEPASSTIFLPSGMSLDLGGIGKGWTVDHVCRQLRSFPGFAVDAGGDIRVAGKQANGSPWTVAVDDPFLKGHNLAILQLYDGAVCTSTIARRKWQLDNAWKHHLIDPRSGEPAMSGVVSATVIAESAAKAEILAKTALILGPDAGWQFIKSQPNLQGILILEDGRLMASKDTEEAGSED